MSTDDNSLRLPSYQSFLDSIMILDLPFSSSELHGIMCGYLCAGEANDGEAYLRTLTPNQKEASRRAAAQAIFELYAISQQQLAHFDLGFQLLLPPEEAPLKERAQAFSEWCEGFMQSLTLAGIREDQLREEEAQDAMRHMTEFALLDYDAVEVDEEDEQALMEVSEYTRLAVLRLCHDLLAQNNVSSGGKTRH